MSICAIHSHPWPSHFHTQILSQLVGSPHPKTAHEIRRPPGALENLHSKLQKNGWAWGEPLTKKGNNLGYTGLGWGKRLQSKKSFSFDQLINLCCQLLALGANRWGRPAGWVLPYGLICCCLYRGSMNRTSYVVEVQTSYDCKTCWWFQRCSIVHPFWDDDPKRPGIVVVVVVVVVVCYSYPHKLLLPRCRALCAYWSVYFSLFIYLKKNYE